MLRVGPWRSVRLAIATGLWLSATVPGGRAASLGDLDDDGVATVRDLARLTGHLNGLDPLPPTLQPLADLDRDGAVAPADADLLILEILGVRDPEALPLGTVQATSPWDGETEIAVTRETIMHFSLPLAPSVTLDTNHLHAIFGGRQLLARVELAGDRRKATLFYLEPLPSNARIAVNFDSTGLTDLLGRPFDADGDGTGGGRFTLSFDTLSITPLTNTAIRGRVFASEPGVGQSGAPLDVPLQGVTITVDGAEETLRATTDAQGDFVLEPCPAGSFFVHVDGRTSPQSAYPNGAYYPTVGKAWYAIAGRTDNLATETGNIYLPKLVPGALQPVSATGRTDIGFAPAVLATYPELAGTLLSVPPNSLFADDGTRGGRVGLAPVPPQRLPEPLPPGLDLPLVITVQTDGGLNFDQPVPVCLPNLPDPATSNRLPPGAASALWSFNHDAGQWEVVGSMTVTADGNFVKTDPGVGIRQPGWHGSRPGAQAVGAGPVAPPDPGGDPDSPTNDTTQAECPNAFGGWDTLDTLYNIVKEAGSCAAGLGRLGTLVQCAHKLLVLNVELLKTAAAFQDAVESGGMSLATAKALLAHARVIKDAILLDNPCIEDISPSNQAKVIFDCIGNAINIGKGICDVIAPEDTELPAHCQPGWLTSSACGAVRGLEFVHKRAATIVNFLTEFEEDFKVAAVNAAFDLMEQLIESWETEGGGQGPAPGQPGVRAAHDRPLTEQELADLNGALTNLLHATGRFLQAGSEYPDLAAQVTEAQRLADTQLQLMSREIARNGRPVQGLSYWAIDSDVITLRGKVQPQRNINALLPPGQPYTLRVYNPAMGLYDEAPGFAPRNGRAAAISATVLDAADASLPDSDGDGVPDPAEHVLGTSTNLPDSDADGIGDLAEALQGTDPAGGLLVQPGLIAQVPTRGSAQDICAGNDLVLTANGPAGISVFNVFGGLNPTRIAEFDTAGSAVGLACFGTRVAVADHAAGLALVDISDPTAVRLVRQVALSDPVTAVTASGPTAYAGTTAGTLYAVDMFTGAILERLFVGAGQIHDLAVAGETLYALRAGTLSAIPLDAGALTVARHVAAPGPAPGGRRLRLFAGTDTLYASWRQGYTIFDTAIDPRAPSNITQIATAQQGWKQIVMNGSGLGLAAVGLNSTPDGPHDIDIYSVGANGRASNYLTTLPTPGLAAAVAVYNGLAYVADSAAGLAVLNYRAFDTLGVPPTIALTGSVNLVTGLVEEGVLLRLSATVTDDVQVRQVTFFIDGRQAWIDGNYPFEYRFVTPPLTTGTFRVQARAEDTGGNTNWSAAYTLTLTPDSRAPRLTALYPAQGALVFPPAETWLRFDEVLATGALAGAVSLLGAGPDDALDTADDVAVTNGTLRFRTEARTAFLAFPTPLAPGFYRLAVSTAATDLAGNQLANPSQAVFQVASDLDTDGDGLPDDWEIALGLDPEDSDSDNDGTRDGREDADGDGVANGPEVYAGLDPRVTDSDGDGVADGAEDADADGLTNAQESALQTGLADADSDDDGFDDFTENATGTNPRDPQSGPASAVSARAAYMNALPAAKPPSLPAGGSAAARVTAYINALPAAKPAPVSASVAARSAAHVNALPEAKPATVTASAAAAVTAYENE